VVNQAVSYLDYIIVDDSVVVVEVDIVMSVDPASDVVVVEIVVAEEERTMMAVAADMDCVVADMDVVAVAGINVVAVAVVVVADAFQLLDLCAVSIAVDDTIVVADTVAVVHQHQVLLVAALVKA
jgi:hypothetical protein